MTLDSFLSHFYPQALALSVDSITFNEGLVLFLSSQRAQGVCPYCHHSSRKLHSHYQRALRDLSCISQAVHIVLKVRRYRCENKACTYQTFAERFDGLTHPYARVTSRLMKVLEQVSLRCGAKPGASLLQIFSLNVSSDALLRCAHKLELAPKQCPKRIGIDDFAFRKGISYGTIIVDLDSGQAIDLLKSRQVDEVADWLKEHPHIDLVTRDRARDYSLAITQGAAQAVQVMDRWHVLKNLREALQKELSSRYDEMKQVFKRNNFAGKALPRSRKEREAKALVMKIKKDRHAQVHKLHQQGVNIVQIAQRLNLSRPTVYAYLHSPEVPQFIRKKRECLTDHYKSHLEMRYQEAKMTIKEVWCELKEKMSYTGSYQSVWRWFYERRQLPKDLMGLKISPRHFASLFVKDEAKLSDREQLIINALDTVPELKQLRSHASDFREALLQGGSAAMKVWLAGVAETPFRFLGNLAQSLKGEWASLMAACDTHYSNGPTEGAVNRLKTIKRMMYGRGSFDLLRKRVLLS